MVSDGHKWRGRGAGLDSSYMLRKTGCGFESRKEVASVKAKRVQVVPNVHVDES